MAGSNAVIGALRVILGVDTAAFDKGLKDSEKTLAHFQANMAKVGATLGVGIAAAAVGIAVGIKKAIDEADKLGKMSQSFGIPVEQLSALKHAADLSGVSIEEVGKSVGKLSKSMSEIAGGATNSAANAFKALGISVKNADGSLKSSTQVMEEVADKFVGMADGAGKTALAMAIFGKAGANMIPMLNQGSAALREARQEAEELGLIIDLKTAKAAEAFNDNLTRLQKVTSGVALRVAAELSPSLAVLTGQFVQAAKDGNIVRATAETIIGGFQGIVLAARAVPIAVEAIAKSLIFLAQVGFAALRFDVINAVEAFKRFQAVGAEADAAFAASRQSIQDFNDQAQMMAQHFANAGSNAGKVAAPVLAAKSALDEFIKSQQKALASQQADAMATGLSAGARERLRVVMQAESVARENNIKLTAAQQIAITTLANAMQQAVLQQTGMNLLLEASEPHEKFRREMAANAAALAAIGATADQIAKVNTMTAQKFGATWTQVTADAAGGFAALANEMGKSNSKIATVAKALAIVEATINTYVAFTKALAATPPPFNYIAAAGVLAAGLAKVAAIKSQSIPKMATGGAMRLDGFASGQDSQLLQARIRPDEQVDIWRPGEGPDPRRGAGGFTVVQMQLPGGAAGRFIEELISDINAKVADGYRLKAGMA